MKRIPLALAVSILLCGPAAAFVSPVVKTGFGNVHGGWQGALAVPGRVPGAFLSAMPRLADTQLVPEGFARLNAPFLAAVQDAASRRRRWRKRSSPATPPGSRP